MTLEYDKVGNRTQTIYPDGKVVTSTFDAANGANNNSVGSDTAHGDRPAGAARVLPPEIAAGS